MSEIAAVKPRRRIWPLVLIGLAVLLLVAGGAIWWYFRPIYPVTLTDAEKTLVEAKVAAIQGNPPQVVPANPEPVYEKGSKDIVLTERELNGLLNENTSLGQSLSFQLGTDVIIARVETVLDPDLPILGGKTLKARARFIVSQADGQPRFVIDDVTIWGISLPNDWLGGLKGQNLLGELLGPESGGRLPGVESFTLRPGELRVRLAD